MSDFDWPLARELFDAIVDLPHADRAAHLGRARVGPEVRAEVERMLRADGATASFLESSSSFLEWALLPRMGTRLGRYELKRVLASGGMGTVFEAVQDEPRRAVALKTLRLGGFSSPERVQRFRFEAEVLGQLRHPSIAQIYEAGTHEEAGEVVPFIAMELVPGARDLLSYAREEGLELPERLALLLEVCEAVQHGHQKGVLHRDLKPGNILVDAEGRAKVIDFGVARATARSSMFEVATKAGQIIGTFAYMAPEQLAGSPDDVDVRTDVYALGILLFELIEGRPPHELESKSPVEALRTIQEEPPQPSSGTPRELRWILEKALAKEPERRYGSVAEFAEDLRRHLRGEAVLAGPPSAAYRLSKWIRRNPAKAASAAIAVLAFVAIVRVNRALGAERTNLANANIALKAKTAEAEVSAAEALENARIAGANERRATEEKERADRESEAATKKTDEVLRLSALQDLDDLVAKADELWPPYPDNVPAYARWVDEARRLLADLPVHRSKRTELRSRASRPREEEEEENVDDPSEHRPSIGLPLVEGEREARWWDSQLTKLIDGLVELEHGLLADECTSAGRGWSIPKRLAFASTLEAGFAPGGEYERAWSAALPDILAAYPGLQLAPQLGLVPIGPDPESGLWEFAHLETGEVAQRGSDGKLILTPGTGIVLVLLPGGSFWMGAQKADPAKPNYDPQARSEEGLHRVQLSPFFLSKYETTQAQWRSVTGQNPSREQGDLLPVEQVTWLECTETCRRIGLSLPAESQWEYAARAGSETPWWSGDEPELLAEVANLADQSYLRSYLSRGARITESWDDGVFKTARVGIYAPNPFGLYDVHGNVWEWCQDWTGNNPPWAEVDRKPVGPGAGLPRARGGSYEDAACSARSALRAVGTPWNSEPNTGCRLARRITP